MRPSPATITAIRAVDLDNKVEQDSLRRLIEQANGRASRAAYSALATGAVGQALDTYEAKLGQAQGRGAAAHHRTG